MAFIKRKKIRPKIKLTEKIVQDILAQYKSHLKRYDVIIPCCMSQIDNEADIFAIRKSGFSDEFEIKLSRADFFKDRNKIVQYRKNDITSGNDKKWFISNSKLRNPIAPWQKLKLDAISDGDMLVNYFWYVVKKGIVEISEIPKFSGIISIDDTGFLEVIRNPEKLHNRKLSFEERFKFASLLNERFWKYRSNQK